MFGWPMPYATEEDLMAEAGDSERLEQLVTNRPGGDRAFWIARALAKGDALINSLVASRYATPIANPSDEVVQKAAEEGVYWLASTRGMATEDETNKAALRQQWAKDIRDGKRSPCDPLPEPTRQAQSCYVANTTAHSRKRMGPFI